jgi:hypothetical protein
MPVSRRTTVVVNVNARDLCIFRICLPVSFLQDEVVTKQEQSLEDARRAGIDLDLMDTILSQSIEERWRQHDAALTLALKLEQAMKARDAGPQNIAQATR